MVFQNYALFPHMTVEKNIGFGLRMRGVPKAEIAPRVEQALKLVQLDGQAHKLPGQLSGGQQQRVAIARAIVIEPPLILMDEPLSNLDAKLRLEMRAEIRRIHRQLGRATIYVTHDQDEALSLADRIVVMKDGVVQQIARRRKSTRSPPTCTSRASWAIATCSSSTCAQSDGDRVALDGTGHRRSPACASSRSTASARRVAIRPEESSSPSARRPKRHRRARRQRRIRRPRFAARRRDAAAARCCTCAARCTSRCGEQRHVHVPRRSACSSIRTVTAAQCAT